jgi:2'-5' RNA ligase
MERIRAFIAVPLPQALLDELGALQDNLERRIPPGSVRWVRPEGIHLTLKFLGDVPLSQVPDFDKALEELSRHAPSCTFTVEGLGCFPNSRRPRVVWVGVQEPTGRLAALQDGVEEAMAHFGFKPEGRGFTPHLTLGRVGRRSSAGQAAQVGSEVAETTAGRLAEVSVDGFVLIRSVLKATGAEYTTLHEYRLTQGLNG